MLRIEDFPLLLGAKYFILRSDIMYMSQAHLLFKRAFLVIQIEMVHVYQGRNVVITLMLITAMTMRMIQSRKVVKCVQVSVLVVLAIRKGQEISLPGGQMQPSVQ